MTPSFSLTCGRGDHIIVVVLPSTPFWAKTEEDPSLLKMNEPVEQFAKHATAFRDWVLTGTSSGHLAAREALLLVCRLYEAGLALPPVWCSEHEWDDTASEKTDFRVLSEKLAKR